MITTSRRAFLGLFILITTGGIARSIAIDDNAVWYEEFWLYDGLTAHHSTFTCSADGDTLISGYVYTRIHQLGVDSISVLGSTEPAQAVPLDRYLGAIRVDEDEHRWYVWFDGYPSELLLYDFNLSLGSTTLGTWGDCGEGLLVNEIDSVLLGTTWRYRYHLDLPGRFLIEGLGSSAGLFGQLCQAFKEFGCLNVYEQSDALLAVDGCGTLSTSIQRSELNMQQSSSYPNPTTGIVYFRGAPEHGSVEVRDGLGRTIVQFERSQPGEAIDLGPLVPGRYTVRIGEWTGRVVKE